MNELKRAFCVDMRKLTESQVTAIYKLAIAFDNVTEYESLKSIKEELSEYPYLGVDYEGDILSKRGSEYFWREDYSLCKGLDEESVLLSYDEAVSLLRTGEEVNLADIKLVDHEKPEGIVSEKAPFVPANDAPPEPVNIVALAVSYDVRITVEADGALSVYLNDTEYLCKTPEQLVDLLGAYDHMKQYEI